MSQSLNGNSANPSGILPNTSPSLEAIISFLRSVQADDSEALAFSKAFEITDFQIGNELADSTLR